jgi:anhydro-N-acetylmuramic acid kinase
LKAKVNNKIQLLGLMSGTSLDGLDIAHVEFDFTDTKKVDFQLLHCKTYPLASDLVFSLNQVFHAAAPDIFELDQQLAKFFAESVRDFLKNFKLRKENISAIASHGQTIYHRPELGYTTQIGSGTTLNFLTEIPVIDQFRQLDVSAGGQGAPLVPLGDQLLFSNYAEGFLNLGGFANISSSVKGKCQAYDIAPANLPMNLWMNGIGKAYDQDGQLARQGEPNLEVLKKVLALSFFHQKAPKSLGTEWLTQSYLPHFEKLTLPNKLRTHLEVLKTLCIQEFKAMKLKRVLITGGGAHHQFFIELLKEAYPGEILLPSKEIIDFKEALIFAFLGARFLRNETTTLAEVTGARQALRTGILHDFQGRIQ